MDILIIEDEIAAQHLLIRLLNKYFPLFKIAGVLDSLTTAVAWLSMNKADLIFMDVELSDGNCFELFKMVEIKSPVIITTAYEHYALKAFNAKCFDYILKPIQDNDFVFSVERCMKFCNKAFYNMSDIEKLISLSKNYKQRFTIKTGTRIMVVEVADIAYFYSESKSTFLVTTDGKRLLADRSLDSIEEELDPSAFFKLSRGCIISFSSIGNISKYYNSRLKISLKPNLIDPIIVPRARAGLFMKWLEGKN